MRIAVIGSARFSKAEAEIAEAVGREIARSGAALICGGLGGVMAGACRGARAEGGITVGILPGESAGDANPDVLVPIPTGLGEARNFLVARSGDAVIAIGGELGTLSELAIALKARIPVVGLNTWRLEEERVPDDAVFRTASGPAEAVRMALELAGRKDTERA
ncbi:MAG: TIGR00725 family protein [Phycisphaerae bacterium]|jgi:hypothetical protein|nr:TIGR00725 family protein [Phycisphaerae bacterium]